MARFVSFSALGGQARQAVSGAVQNRRQLSGSPLRGALLAVLLGEGGRPLSGYRLATLIERRLGPAWRMTRQSIYGALDRLEGEGLVHSRHGESGQRLYIPGIGAEAMFETWMAGPVVKEPVRVELQAKIAMSRPKDAPLLLGALDGYERDCFEMLRSTNAAEVPMQSWRGLAMNLTRLAVDEGLQAELRWIAIARRAIEDFTSSPHRERS